MPGGRCWRCTEPVVHAHCLCVCVCVLDVGNGGKPGLKTILGTELRHVHNVPEAVLASDLGGMVAPDVSREMVHRAASDSQVLRRHFFDGNDEALLQSL